MTRRGSRRKLMLITFLAVLAFVGYGGPGVVRTALSGAATCTILTVVDGDTVRAFCPDQGVMRVRLTGFDTPEIYAPRCFGEWWGGARASWALSRQLWLARRTKLMISGRDRYGRALAALYLDGENVATRMIGQGYARAYSGGPRKGWCA